MRPNVPDRPASSGTGVPTAPSAGPGAGTGPGTKAGFDRPSPPTPGGGGIVLRPLTTRRELGACVALQKAVWGQDFLDVTPPALLKVVQEMGGVAAGAFSSAGTRAGEGDAEGEGDEEDGERLEGFVFGVSGLRAGRPAHWSHMLAVRRDVRGQGVGALLKRYQRDRLLDIGIETVFWTFDPLVARNAHLNLVRLGAGIERYVRDYYGSGGDSALSAGIGTDRLVVRWELSSERVGRALAGEGPVLAADLAAWQDAPVLGARAGSDPVEPAAPEEIERAAAWRDAPAVRVEIPADILGVRDQEQDRGREPERARRWRLASRTALETGLAGGFRVESFLQTGGAAGGGALRCWYLLVRDEP